MFKAYLFYFVMIIEIIKISKKEGVRAKSNRKILKGSNFVETVLLGIKRKGG